MSADQDRVFQEEQDWRRQQDNMDVQEEMEKVKAIEKIDYLLQEMKDAKRALACINHQIQETENEIHLNAQDQDKILAEMAILSFLHRVATGMSTVEDVSNARVSLRILGVNV